MDEAEVCVTPQRFIVILIARYLAVVHPRKASFQFIFVKWPCCTLVIIIDISPASDSLVLVSYSLPPTECPTHSLRG